MTLVLIRKLTLALIIALFTAMPSAVFAQSPLDISAAIVKKAKFAAAAERRQIETETFIRTELFFGRNKPDGTEVSQEEFDSFLSDTITPEFPDGLTVLDAVGQFRDADAKIIREKAKILILLYPSNAKRQSSRKIERIRTAYKARFNQQSVLRVDDVLPVKISF